MLFENSLGPLTAFYAYVVLVVALWAVVGMFIRSGLRNSATENRVKTLAEFAAYVAWIAGGICTFSFITGPVDGSRLVSYGEMAMLSQVVLAITVLTVSMMYVLAMSIVTVVRTMNELWAGPRQ